MTENTQPEPAPAEVPDPEPPHDDVEPWDEERAAAEGIPLDPQAEPAPSEPPDAP